WGRRPETTETSVEDDRARVATFASMGPPSGDDGDREGGGSSGRRRQRFNGAAVRRRRRRGRRVREGVAVRGSNGAGVRRRRRPGETRVQRATKASLQWGRRPETTETWATSTRGRRSNGLQWGRRPETTETGRVQRPGRREACASMGPPSGDDGDTEGE